MLDSKVRLDLLVQLVHLEVLEQQEMLAHQDCKEHRVELEQQDPLDHGDLRELLVVLDILDRLEPVVTLD